MILGRTPYGEPDPYEVLGVAQEADKREVNRIYRERMRGLAMQDKRFQEVQQAKEVLTKPKKRVRADLRHVVLSGATAEIRRRYAGQVLGIALPPLAQVALLVSEVADPRPEADYTEPRAPSTKIPLSPALTADPVAPRLDAIGP